MNDPISPYGGKLTTNLCSADEARTLIDSAATIPSLQLTDRELCDLELILVGAFSPIVTFMGRDDYQSVVSSMRTSDGILFPVPITLSTDDVGEIAPGAQIALRDRRNDVIAMMTVTEVYEWYLEDFCRGVLGTTDDKHPLVAEARGWGRFHLSGQLRGIRLPANPAFSDLRRSPIEMRARLRRRGVSSVAAFQTRNPIHRAHETLIRAALKRADTVLVHPVVGLTKTDDVDTHTRVRTYRALFDNYLASEGCELAVLPLAMRFAGPREALWHAIIRRNYGADKFIVGRDHASPGMDSNGRPFYEPDAARLLAIEHQEELGVEILAFDEFVYSEGRGDYVERKDLSAGETVKTISGTQARRDYLDLGIALPEWFTRPEVASILAGSRPPKDRQGFCLWFTGLSGAGKTTTAEIVSAALESLGRSVTLLDGDVVRTHLSKGLGFSRQDRDTNIRRIGFVASEIVRHGGVAVCAAISPFAATRREIREMMPAGRFIEIYVDATVETCEARDSKGMYRKARQGLISDFTGINSPYEIPENSEMVIDGGNSSPESNANRIVDHVLALGLVGRR